MTEKATNSKSGIGAGSASVVLIFSVLCLTVFTLITYIVAGNNKTLVDAEVKLVTGYYEADALAEKILCGIIDGYVRNPATLPPGRLHGIDISVKFDEELGAETLYYYCPISGTKSLYVNTVLREDSCDILSWRMVDTDDWSPEAGINVWDGG